ncbi:MAG: alanine racemase [Actinomycetia bacterium]|nr:alanine racemase [Actinomycetes bacterium]MCH9761444.1 alanine racemase [Actinomycetes bacterium]
MCLPSWARPTSVASPARSISPTDPRLGQSGAVINTANPTPNVPRALPTASVDLDAIAHNVATLREHAGSAAVMAVVKADGYGHGATPVARAALAAGAAELGVATLDEALALRRDGITGPVLAWLHTPHTDFAPALRADVEVAVSSEREVDDVVAAARRTGHTATVTIKADTGLNRNGVGEADYPAVLAALTRAHADGAVRVRGIMSHLVYGDEPDHAFNDLQAQRLTGLVALASAQGIRFDVVHLSNSPAVLTRPDLAFDMVRPGIAVYGLNPLPGRGDMGLRPAMTVTCPVAMIRPLKAGEGVSYGHNWIAKRDTTVALIPAGYADGVFRSLSGRIEVSINGRRYAGVGRICMDQFVVDLGPGPTDVAVGDTAILFGPGVDGEPTAQDWAESLGTINYEIATSPRGRIVRKYQGGGEFR